MSDRLAQARAEAERRYPGGRRRFTEANLQAAFRQGWLAADANPKPRTITRKELNTAMLRAPRGSGGAGVLAQLGIEVEDSDE